MLFRAVVSVTSASNEILKAAAGAQWYRPTQNGGNLTRCQTLHGRRIRSATSPCLVGHPQYVGGGAVDPQARRRRTRLKLSGLELNYV